TTPLRLLQRFPVHPALCRVAVLHRGDERDGSLEGLQGAGTDVARGAATGRVAPEPHLSAALRDRSVLAYAAVGFPNRGPEEHQPCDGVEHEVPILGATRGEVLHRAPFLP